MLAMRPQHALFTRRSVVALTLASVFLPRSVFGQIATNAARPAGGISMKIRCTFAEQSFTATLYDNPSAHDFATMLPLGLEMEDYSTNEKIAILPRKLTEDSEGPFPNEAPGDLCYYAPWGNLVFFYDSYRYSKGLIRLGRLDDGFNPLLKRGKFSLRIERLS
jgi:hypothetical protein